MPRRKQRPKSEWKLPQGSICISGDTLQICDAQNRAPIELTHDELGEWLDAMTEAFNVMSGVE